MKKTVQKSMLFLLVGLGLVPSFICGKGLARRAYDMATAPLSWRTRGVPIHDAAGYERALIMEAQRRVFDRQDYDEVVLYRDVSDSLVRKYEEAVKGGKHNVVAPTKFDIEMEVARRMGKNRKQMQVAFKQEEVVLASGELQEPEDGLCDEKRYGVLLQPEYASNEAVRKAKLLQRCMKCKESQELYNLFQDRLAQRGLETSTAELHEMLVESDDVLSSILYIKEKNPALWEEYLTGELPDRFVRTCVLDSEYTITDCDMELVGILHAKGAYFSRQTLEQLAERVTPLLEAEDPKGIAPNKQKRAKYEAFMAVINEEAAKRRAAEEAVNAKKDKMFR